MSDECDFGCHPPRSNATHAEQIATMLECEPPLTRGDLAGNEVLAIARQYAKSGEPPAFVAFAKSGEPPVRGIEPWTPGTTLAAPTPEPTWIELHNIISRQAARIAFLEAHAETLQAMLADLAPEHAPPPSNPVSDALSRSLRFDLPPDAYARSRD